MLHSLTINQERLDGSKAFKNGRYTGQRQRKQKETKIDQSRSVASTHWLLSHSALAFVSTREQATAEMAHVPSANALVTGSEALREFVTVTPLPVLQIARGTICRGVYGVISCVATCLVIQNLSYKP